MKANPFWLLPPLAIGTGAALPALVRADFTPNPTHIERPQPGDAWWNYDYNAEDLGSDVDWPINMVWAVKGEVNDVKNWLKDYNCSDRPEGWTEDVCTGWHSHPVCDPPIEDANYKYVYLTENGNTPTSQWDRDCGVKSGCQWFSEDTMGEMHTRLYAPTGSPNYDQFVSDEWGYYILGTTHYDYNDYYEVLGVKFGCYIGQEKEYGYNETVESKTGAIAKDGGLLVSGNVRTYPTPSPPNYRDDTGMSNEGYGYYPGGDTQYHQSDGDATMVYFKEDKCFIDMWDPYTGGPMPVEVECW